ncbi:MAG: YgiQ family radical SAM protein [Anaerolineaceae bacterium]|nr:YgiQ family radical SAM protein [Anaerolineaceae bacterium]
MKTKFLPTTRKEMQVRGWEQLDVILISGDSYIDSPYIGIAVIGRVLENAGFRVGIIAQPDIKDGKDITRLGEPLLFWGVSGGSVDSMVANYTASNRKRKRDDYTPGGENDRRPNRAVIAYTNLIRRNFKNTVPIVLGGIEASLRRVAHYDFWSNSVRRSILFDAKADYLLYGMAEQSVISLAQNLKNKEDLTDLTGLCYISKDMPDSHLELPSYEKVISDKEIFIDMFHTFYRNNDPITAKGLVQQHGNRFLVQNPPTAYTSQAKLDHIYGLPFQRDLHPHYARQGKVKALETIKFSINTHHGCYGECNFCSIAVHEGRTVRWRSQQSILSEAEILIKSPGFKGYILDIGGPTANMYGFECQKKLSTGACQDKQCLFPETCKALKPNHKPLIKLLKNVRALPGIKKVFVGSGIRYDMVLSDKNNGRPYLKEIVEQHVSGQLKIAPEHTEEGVLRKMGKPGQKDLIHFKNWFDELTKEAGKDQYLTYYLIAAHPGCTVNDMQKLKQFTRDKLNISPEQVQLFTPLPSTYSSLMYYTELDPFTLKPIFVEKDSNKREKQKEIVVKKPAQSPRKPYQKHRRR